MTKCGKSVLPECEYFTTGGCVSPFNCPYKVENESITTATSTPCNLYPLETDKDKEISRLQAENAELRARLEKAVELPCKVGDTVYYIQYFCNYKKCDSITQQICCGCKEMIERERRNEKYVICEKPFELKDLTEIGKKYFTTRAEAEARIKELQGGER